MANHSSQFESAQFNTGDLYQALTQVNRLFIDSMDKTDNEVFGSLVEILVEKLGLILALVAVLPVGQEWIDIVSVAGSAAGYPSDLRISAREDLLEGQGPMGFALRTGKVNIIDVTEPRFAPWQERAAKFGVGGGMAVPFDFPNGAKGLVCLYRGQGKPFVAHLNDLLARLGEDMTGFFRRKREHDQLLRLSRYQEAIGVLLHRLLALPDPHTAYGEVTRILTEKTDALGAWVSVPDGIFLKTVAGNCQDELPELKRDLWVFRPKIVEDGTPATRSVASRAFRSTRPVLTHAGLSSTLKGLKTVYPSLTPVRVAGAWPVVISGEPIAVLVIVSEDPEYFSLELRALLEQLIDGIRIAVQNFENQAEARRISRVYQALLTEGDLLFTAQDEHDFLTQTSVRLQESGLYKTVWIGLAKEDGSLEPVAYAGENISKLLLLFESSVEPSGIQTTAMNAILSGRVEYVDEYAEAPGAVSSGEISERNTWRSSVSIPIERAGKIWGVLNVLSGRPMGFSEDMIELLSRVSQMVSHGLSEIDLREELSSDRNRQSWLASHDPLTGLPNRRGLEDHITEAIARSKRHGTLLAVGMLDLDDFKALNDNYGHDLGDQVLKELTGSLRDAMRQTDLLARVGGDEFVVVLEDVRRYSDLTKVLQKLENVLNSPLSLPDGTRISVGGSLGLSIYSGDEGHPDELLHQADQALYLLKRRKGYRSRDWAFNSPNDSDGISIYPVLSPDIEEKSQRSVAQALLHSGGLQVLYQPIVRLSTGKVVGVEALARLVSVDGTVYGPKEFLSDLMLDDQKLLTLSVLSFVKRDLNLLESAGVKLWCSINLIPELITSDRCLGDMVKEFSKLTLGASRITLEVVDNSNFLSTYDAARRLISLSELGLDLALDDIGSTYSSLLRLHELPIDKVKLDQEFVRTLGLLPDGFRYLISMSDLARSLSLDFIAEGVETFPILDALMSLGIDYAQGFAISRPLSFDDLKVWLPSFELDLSSERPMTVLGLYALFVRHSFGYHQRLLSDFPAVPAGECALSSHLIRLGFSGSPLEVSHDAYHEELQKYHNAHDQRPNPFLRSVEEARETLRAAILAAVNASFNGD